MFDIEDNSDLSVTPLDLERLKDLQMHERVDGECGMWVVFRNKNDFMLTIDTDREHKILEFKSLGEVIGYLKES